MIANQHILMDIIGESVTFVNFVQTAADMNVGTTVTGSFDVTPTDGNLILLFYRTTSGAPTTTPSGVTLLSSVDNNGLGIYVYSKTASGETNSYIFGDASSNEKGVICAELSNFSDVDVYITEDSGAVTVGMVNLPSVGTQLYPAGAYALGVVVLRDNRSITRNPFDFAIGAPTTGTVGTFRLHVAFHRVLTNESFVMEYSWPSATRAKALSIVIT